MTIKKLKAFVEKEKKIANELKIIAGDEGNTEVQNICYGMAVAYLMVLMYIDDEFL